MAKRTLKVKSKYQYKTEKARLERCGFVILECGKIEEGIDVFTHFITYEKTK